MEGPNNMVVGNIVTGGGPGDAEGRATHFGPDTQAAYNDIANLSNTACNGGGGPN